MEIKAAIEKLFADPNITNYQIHKATGISQVSLNKFSKGESNVDNMPLGNAIKLYDCYKKIEGDGEMNNENRDMLFGRLLGVANTLGSRVFEKGKPTIDEKLFKKFPRTPVSVWTKLHEDLMGYTHKFGKEENEILSVVDEIMSEMDVSDYTDNPLGNTYLLGYYRQNHELREYHPSNAKVE